MAKKTILLVDDEEDILTNLETYLASLGYQVLKASNGTEALDLLHVTPVDLVLLDIMMPQESGIELLKKIRETEALKGISMGKGIAVIMLTALHQPVLEAFKNGCNDYLVKPCQNEDLGKKIQEILYPFNF